VYRAPALTDRIRTVLGLSLLIAVLSSSVPFAMAGVGSCKLACCATRASHAEGSCMDGSCHAFLNQGSHPTVKQPTEQLCGVSRLINPASGLSQRIVTDHVETLSSQSEKARDHSRVSTASINTLCRTDCGGCVSGSASSSRSRDAAALAYANDSRLTSKQFARFEVASIQNLSGVTRHCAPRGPPLFC
jgi:hypothetical protein